MSYTLRTACDNCHRRKTRCVKSPQSRAACTTDLSFLLLKLNEYIPQSLLGQSGHTAFESISFLVSTLCETILLFESQPFQQRDTSCFIHLVSVAGSVVNTYYQMVESLGCYTSNATTGRMSVHELLQLLAVANTMEFQLACIRRICQQIDGESGTGQTVSRIDATLDILQRLTHLSRMALQIR